MVCASCGTESPAGFRFCGACGAELALIPSPRHESRKTVTLLFCDVVGSTALGERLDPEALRRVMTRYFDEMTTIIERHGGTVEKFVGDAVMAVFGIPRVREDDALRAVRAAVEIHQRLPAVGAELGVSLTWRTGVNTGEVVVGEGQTLATGDGVNVAARLEQAASPGEILIGADTHRLVHASVEVEPVEPLALKGKAEPVPAFRLLRVAAADPGVTATDVMSVFVGRQRELQLLHQAFERSVDGACHLFTLLGSAGVGKSRLVARFLDEVQHRATVVRGRCLSYGDAITFFPLVEVLTQLGPDGADTLRLISEGGATTPNEVFLSVRRTLERAAADRPLVLVVDDLHWAEPMLLDLVDHVADLSRGAPLLLLCVARPELLDERPGWGGGKLNATTVLLEPLQAAECAELLAAVAADLDPATQEHVAAASEGNPLFAVEMVALAQEGGDVTASPTIAAILAARLDQLGDDERAVIERGAVEGKVFHTGAVRALAPDLDALSVDRNLSSLVRKDLVRPQAAADLPDEDAYRFRHLLVRDAAYDALPKRVRADLHEQFAGWLEEHATGLVELAELVGWHFEQAIRYRLELGLEVDPQLVEHAGGQLLTAAEGAQARADVRAADKLLTRALDLLPAGTPGRVSALVQLADIAIRRGELDRADRLLVEAETGPPAPAVVAGRLEWLSNAAPDRVSGYVAEVAQPLLDRPETADDDAGLALLHFALFNVSWFAAQAAAGWERLERAAEHARRSDNHLLERRIRTMSSGPLMFGPAPADEIRRAIAAAEVADAGPLVESGLWMLRGQLDLMTGDLVEARAAGEKACDLLRELGMDVLAATIVAVQARVAIAEGDPAQAVRLLRAADAELAALGERGYRSTVVALLAEALYVNGDVDEAERRAAEATEISAREDVVNFVITYAVRARILADRGDLAAAAELARDGLDLADRTDFPIERAEARAALAYALGRAGRVDEAADLLNQGIALCESKGHRTQAAALRDELDRLSPAG